MAIADTSGAFEGVPARRDARRYDLDWLRVIAFGLLIFYHVGMFYVTWDWHVKSVYAGPGAEPLMLLVNPWRLALLFFISGVAVRFATDKSPSSWGFAGSRLYRLGLPILMGVIVVVAPQSYYELRQAGAIEPGYLAFWGNYLKLEQLYPMTTPTWNHLWYVVYLLVYILLIAPVLPFLRRFAEGAGAKALSAVAGGPVRLLLLIIIPFVIYELALVPHFPTTHDLVNDWANHAHRFTIFMLGYFAAKHDGFWRSVERALPIAAFIAVGLGALRLYLRAWHNDFYVGLFEGVSAPLVAVLMILYAWSCIVLLLGLAQRFLNRPSKTLTYLTGAIFCYYILHQTITVTAGYYLTQLQLGPWPEFIGVTAATAGGCVAGYEILRRIPVLRVFFGIREALRGRAMTRLAPVQR
ncbi:acyltransferase family protein [Hyphococcus sp.]|jgi:surface polysaccharide O-acyltransferase-like enzyme|uniref:acyltransferase family protein n=1 Tax=Hyphococcus sp. TaxID=2038636 RepID=UPI003D098550